MSNNSSIWSSDEENKLLKSATIALKKDSKSPVLNDNPSVSICSSKQSFEIKDNIQNNNNHTAQNLSQEDKNYSTNIDSVKDITSSDNFIETDHRADPIIFNQNTDYNNIIENFKSSVTNLSRYNSLESSELLSKNNSEDEVSKRNLKNKNFYCTESEYNLNKKNLRKMNRKYRVGSPSLSSINNFSRIEVRRPWSSNNKLKNDYSIKKTSNDNLIKSSNNNSKYCSDMNKYNSYNSPIIQSYNIKTPLEYDNNSNYTEDEVYDDSILNYKLKSSYDRKNNYQVINQPDYIFNKQHIDLFSREKTPSKYIQSANCTSLVEYDPNPQININNYTKNLIRYKYPTKFHTVHSRTNKILNEISQNLPYNFRPVMKYAMEPINQSKNARIRSSFVDGRLLEFPKYPPRAIDVGTNCQIIRFVTTRDKKCQASKLMRTAASQHRPFTQDQSTQKPRRPPKEKETQVFLDKSEFSCQARPSVHNCLIGTDDRVNKTESEIANSSKNTQYKDPTGMNKTYFIDSNGIYLEEEFLNNGIIYENLKFEPHSNEISNNNQNKNNRSYLQLNGINKNGDITNKINLNRNNLNNSLMNSHMNSLNYNSANIQPESIYQNFSDLGLNETLLDKYTQ